MKLNKSSKKFISIFLIIVMITGLLPYQVFSDTNVEILEKTISNEMNIANETNISENSKNIAVKNETEVVIVENTNNQEYYEEKQDIINNTQNFNEEIKEVNDKTNIQGLNKEIRDDNKESIENPSEIQKYSKNNTNNQATNDKINKENQINNEKENNQNLSEEKQGIDEPKIIENNVYKTRSLESKRTFDIQTIDYWRACKNFGLKYESRWEGVVPYGPIFGHSVNYGKDTRPLGEENGDYGWGWGSSDWLTGYILVDLDIFGQDITKDLPRDEYGLSSIGIVRVNDKFSRTDDFSTWQMSVLDAFKEYNGNLGFGKEGWKNKDVYQATKLVVWDGYRRFPGFTKYFFNEYVKEVVDISSNKVEARRDFCNYVKKHIENGAKLDATITVANGLKYVYEPTYSEYKNGESQIIKIPQIKIKGVTYDVELEHVNAPESIDLPNIIKVKAGDYIKFPNIDGYSKQVFDIYGNVINNKIIVDSNKKFVLKWENETKELDTDLDGLSDYLEINLIGTDPNNPDTDGDGLSDYIEIYKTFTNPLKKDTDDNGILDSDEDYDNDGLTNREELEIGTDPIKFDTDNDGLSDGDEKLKYFTNPLNPDTDSDGLLDGDEIELGLDPKKLKTDGKTLDSEVKIAQTIKDFAKSSSILESDNWLKPSISGIVAKNLSRNVCIDKSYSHVLEDNRSVLSDVIEITTNYTDNISLSFKFIEEYKGNINNLFIAKYDDDLHILDTKLDIDNGILCADINNSGNYFVIDLYEFLKGFGIDAFEDVSPKIRFRSVDDFNNLNDEYFYKYDNYGNLIEKKLKDKSNFDLINPFKLSNTFRSIIDTDGDKFVKGKADIVFVVDTTGSMYNAIQGVKNNINRFANELVHTYNVDANFALIEYKDIEFDGKDTTIVHKSSNSNWFTNVEVFKDEIASLYVNGGGDNPETPIDALELARNLDFRVNSTKLVILVTDASYKMNNNYNISNLQEMAQLFKKRNIIVSAISDNKDYDILLNTTDGVFGWIYNSFYHILLQLANKIGYVTNSDGEWIILSDYSVVKLSDKVENRYKNDTDKDGLKDGEELTNFFEKDFILDINKLFTRNKIQNGKYQGNSKIVLWNYLTNPVFLDTDYDGIPDGNVDYDGTRVRKDLKPNDNNFSAILHWTDGKVKKFSREPLNFSVDYRLLFENNKKYEKKLAELCSLYAGDIYDETYLDIKNLTNINPDNPISLLRTFGMKDVEDIKIGENVSIDVDDKSEIVIGHRQVEYKNTKKEIILLVIRGTNNTNSEWSSNFDLGADTKEYYERTGYHPEWINKENHKGFDVTTNRIIAEVKNYMKRNSLNNSEKIMLITGHSRGAGISNLLGKYFTDNTRDEIFVYTFASPNTTTDVNNATKYKNIFNLVNEDDIITKMPLKHWGFTKYGVTKSISVEMKYEFPFNLKFKRTWEYFVGKDYNNDSGIQRTLNSFKAICNTREEIYINDETSSGIGYYKKNILTYKDAQIELEKAKEQLRKEKLLKFCDVSIEKYNQIITDNYNNYYNYNNYKVVDRYNIKVQYCPAYLMQVLANMTTSVGPILGRDVSGKYAWAKSSFVMSSGELSWYFIIMGGMTDPHLPITYYLIANGNKFVESQRGLYE